MKVYNRTCWYLREKCEHCYFIIYMSTHKEISYQPVVTTYLLTLGCQHFSRRRKCRDSDTSSQPGRRLGPSLRGRQPPSSRIVTASTTTMQTQRAVSERKVLQIQVRRCDSSVYLVVNCDHCWDVQAQTISYGTPYGETEGSKASDPQGKMDCSCTRLSRPQRTAVVVFEIVRCRLCTNEQIRVVLVLV